MPPHPADLLPPRIALLDDERPIHSAVRLRLGPDCDFVSFLRPAEALARIRVRAFDLCFVDLHMPEMDGFAFIEAASAADPDLGFVILSAFDTEENLRRAIPLQVLEFVPKPLPDRTGFEARLPGWIERTRARRRTRGLALHSATVAADLDAARLERDIEATASDSTRDILAQTSGFLSVIHAHLVGATLQLGEKARLDPALVPLLRNLEEARRSADAAITAADRFFDVAYGRRDDSAALLGEALAHAANVARRAPAARDREIRLEIASAELPLPVAELSGIALLLLLTPVFRVAVALAPPRSAVRTTVESAVRLDGVWRDPACRNFSWFNRRQTHGTRPGYLVRLTVAASPAEAAMIEAWLSGQPSTLEGIPNRGLVDGLVACHGCFGFPQTASRELFQLVLALPGGIA